MSQERSVGDHPMIWSNSITIHVPSPIEDLHRLGKPEPMFF